MKAFFKIAVFLLMIMIVPAHAADGTATIHATVAKDGQFLSIEFEESVPVDIEFSDTPLAIQFERTDGQWSMTLFETKVLNGHDFPDSTKITVYTSDAVMVREGKIILLNHIQTYESCPLPKDSTYIWFGTYNFSIRVHCPTISGQTSD